ncbi:MAG TPA: molybdopterin cofactor-binding domain-containing protein [Xanthobacteraceae bacterium]|nr:molybdopterin cofactor-binding domain-containing protein [Xanthobacteraceae bacterium]
MTSGELLSRRSFLVGVSAVGGGLALSLAVPFDSVRTAEEAPEVTAWLLIGADNAVVIRVARAEMGQGAHTGLAMLVAEELECDWAKVSTEFVSPQKNMRRDRVWGDMSTGASRSIASSQLYLRQAGATAREMLIAAAAARWNVPAFECVAAMSVITHQPSGRKLAFGAVAEAAAKVPPPADVKLKDPRDWKLAGKPRRRLDVPAKVTAQPIYAIDVRLPGMLYAAIAHCPVFGGAPKAVNDGAIANMKGVRRVVRLPNAVAVIADSWWHAKRAVEALPIEWDPRGNGRVSTASIADIVRAGLSAEKSQVGRSDGDVAAAMQSAVKLVEADYEVPFLAHATMEPQTCTAHVANGEVEVWVPTQEPMTALATAASAAGVPNEKVVVHGTFLGGGFGRRAAIQEFVRQAVLIAKEVDVPVKLLWSREEDIKHDYYRPFGMARLVAGLGADGMPIAWKVRIAGPSFVHGLVPGFGMSFVDRTFISGLADEMAYDVPNYLVDYVVEQSPVPLGVWRAINYTQNTFYKESFVDEMAHAAGMDPYLYRRHLLRNNAKHLAVLDAAAKKADWFSPLPEGMRRGIAVTEACGSVCAQVVEASVERGEVRVHRVVSALDCGNVVNPLSIEMQTEGAVIYALTAALTGEITIENGGVEQSNFDTYEMLRIADAPKVETVLAPSGNFWGGAGEPPVPPLAPALCNAIFAATGKRIRSLPIKNQDLTKAI